jgi:outer membrane immunogenic protein
MVRALSAFALSLLSTAAFAADFPMINPPMAAAGGSAFDWTGFYVGASGGWAFAGDGEAEYDYSGAFEDADFVTLAPGSADLETDGFLVGGTLGFNLQNGNYLFGLEGDISWSDISGEDTFSSPGDVGLSVEPFEVTTEFDMEWFGTLRGRVGFAADRVLVYATGGAAFADMEITTSVVSDPVASGDFSGSDDGIELGWTAGAGVEFALTERWSVKAEALYYDLGEVSATATDDLQFPGDEIETSLEVNGVIARGGINFRF